MDLMQILLLYSFYGICSDMYVYTVYLIYIYIVQVLGRFHSGVT